MRHFLQITAVLLTLSIAAFAQQSAASDAACKPIAMQKLDLAAAGKAADAQVRATEVLTGEIQGVSTHLVSIRGPGQHIEPATADREVIWLFIAGKGTLQTKDMTYEIEGEAIARAPLGWSWQIDVPQGEVLHALRVRKFDSADDRQQLQKFPQNNQSPHVKKFSECPAYREAIKSPKTVSRTLLPENYVPRVAMGTVETTGPDTVGAHRHPMLEQLFLGLKDNDITITADEASAQLTSFAILHIPLGSNHGALVAEGKKLYYVWMDFFITKEGQDWLKMHQAIEPNEKP
jgi:hypothetical protein